MTILLFFHFGTFRNFKHYYLFFIKGTMKTYFPKGAYNRFVELESRVFLSGFKLHLACNDSCEIIAIVLTGANVSDKDPNVFKVLAKRLYGKLFADKGYTTHFIPLL